MRERRVACRNASFDEFRRGIHMTLNDSALCDACSSRGVRVPGVAQAPPPSSPPAMFEGSGLSSQGPGPSAPTVLEPCTASGGGSSFDDGFLSRPSPGEQSLSGGASPCLPEPVPTGTAHRLLAGSGDSPAPMSGMCRPGHSH